MRQAIGGDLTGLKKATRIEIKKLKKMAIRDTFSIVRNRHIKVFLSMKDDAGTVKKLRFIFAATPGDGNWMKVNRRQIKKYLEANNITSKAA